MVKGQDRVLAVRFTPSPEPDINWAIAQSVADDAMDFVSEAVECAMQADNLPVDPYSSLIAGITCDDESTLDMLACGNRKWVVRKRGEVFATVTVSYPDRERNQPPIIRIRVRYQHNREYVDGDSE